MRHSMRAALAALLCCATPVMAATVQVQDPVPFSEEAYIPRYIMSECQMGQQLARALAERAGEFGNTVQLQAEPGGQGRVLKLEFIEANGKGNMFLGFGKSATVRGELYEDGRRLAGVTARRSSGLVSSGGNKGSCEALERIVTAIGGDLAQWLADPVDNVRLGDTR
ncbi:hypothetical protein [uncultured Stenotrophomonas sp.]|uniref:hypothetical protein n=1 Tax=uncultured Stenotrophomonas sp. TaxID=165438 RepID=UPI0028D1C794|nr:hypothetical protein [uncultured Stenotrophomonas sp.]